MRIINFIKNYPACISTFLLMIISISIIIISAKAHAYYNEPGCECVNQKSCPKDIKEYCHFNAMTRDCTCEDPKYTCSTPAIQICKYVGQGCGCCDEDDCNIVNEDLWGRWADGCPSDCGPCIMYSGGVCPGADAGENGCVVPCLYSSWVIINSFTPQS